MLDVKELESQLRKEVWPILVRSWRVERGLDSRGEDAVWVWSTLDAPLEHPDERAELRRRVRERAWEMEDGVWAHVRFRNTAEADVDDLDVEVDEPDLA